MKSFTALLSFITNRDSHSAHPRAIQCQTMSVIIIFYTFKYMVETKFSVITEVVFKIFVSNLRGGGLVVSRFFERTEFFR